MGDSTLADELGELYFQMPFILHTPMERGYPSSDKRILAFMMDASLSPLAKAFSLLELLAKLAGSQSVLLELLLTRRRLRALDIGGWEIPTKGKPNQGLAPAPVAELGVRFSH